MIVVVTRWYGGVLLGADRFKLINQVRQLALCMRRNGFVTGIDNHVQAARDALQAGGFLVDEKGSGKGRTAGGANSKKR